MIDLTALDRFRLRDPVWPDGGAFGGIFEVPSPATGARLRVIASNGYGWDHVSVSTPRRCPNWPEMCRVKELFFRPDETVMQLHVPADEHVNMHPFALHLWRPHVGTIPKPPASFVGRRDISHDEVLRMSIVERRALVRSEGARFLAGQGTSA